MPAPGGSVILSTSGVVLVSGDAVRIYGIQITSGATAGAVTLKNGTNASGTAFISGAGAPNSAVGAGNFPANGVYFPGGCYASFDSNVTQVIVSAESVSTL